MSIPARSQGKTVDRVFIAVGNESRGAANRQQWYVSLSRGREMVKVYVDSKEDVRNADCEGTGAHVGGGADEDAHPRKLARAP